MGKEKIEVDKDWYMHMQYLGLTPDTETRNHNVGQSNYSLHTIQPWSIWQDYPGLTPFDCDIIKRVLRDKTGEPRKQDYQKIIHICQERIRQIDVMNLYIDKRDNTPILLTITMRKDMDEMSPSF